MKIYTLVWTESHGMDVEAESEEDAREMFTEVTMDYSKSECFESELCEVYEARKEETP